MHKVAQTSVLLTAEENDVDTLNVELVQGGVRGIVFFMVEVLDALIVGVKTRQSEQLDFALSMAAVNDADIIAAISQHKGPLSSALDTEVVDCV